MSARRQGYTSYLIRLWPACHVGGVVWRVSLEDPHTGQRIGFTGLNQLFAFLIDQTAAVQEHQPPPDAEEPASG